MAIIGDVNRFLNAKKLVGYIGLSPSKVQSGNNVKGREKALEILAEVMRALLVQSAQNALNYRESALHKWGRKLALKNIETSQWLQSLANLLLQSGTT